MPQPDAFIPYHVPVPNRRPTPVLVLGILGIVLSSFTLLAHGFSLAMVMIILPDQRGVSVNPGDTRADLIWFAVQTIAAWLFYSVLLWASIAAIRLRLWAHAGMLRWAGLYLAWLGLETVVTAAWALPKAGAAAGTSGPTASAVFEQRMGYLLLAVSVTLAALYPIFVIVFMRKPHVRAAFGAAAGGHGSGTAPAPGGGPEGPLSLPPLAVRVEP
jgi:hypothetical protein